MLDGRTMRQWWEEDGEAGALQGRAHAPAQLHGCPSAQVHSPNKVPDTYLAQASVPSVVAAEPSPHSRRTQTCVSNPCYHAGKGLGVVMPTRAARAPGSGKSHKHSKKEGGGSRKGRLGEDSGGSEAEDEEEELRTLQSVVWSAEAVARLLGALAKAGEYGSCAHELGLGNVHTCDAQGAVEPVWARVEVHNQAGSPVGPL